jgi:phosphoribosylformylglycinamidine (FGAM) synthase PurS component
LDFARQDLNPKPEDLDRAAEAIRQALRSLGYPEVAA